MKERIDDPIYEVLRSYDHLLLDYMVLGFHDLYQGEQSHKEAVIEAITGFGSRERVGNNYSPGPFSIDESQMKCRNMTVEEFFFEGNNGYSLSPKEAGKTEIPDKMNYYLAFFDPPYGTDYTLQDFRKINQVLFPVSQEDLEIYEWNDEFSDYFDDGKDWWGTALWSIYDRSLERFVIIGASLSD